MAKLSRSNKKQPAFDPSELDDLIFSPAVGNGVGSHLILARPGPLPPFPEADAAFPIDPRDLTTVVASVVSTVVGSIPEPAFTPSSAPQQVFPLQQDKDQFTSALTDLTTVDNAHVSTVVKKATVAAFPAVKKELDFAEPNRATVIESPPLETQVLPSPRTKSVPGSAKQIWQTDRGELIPEARVKRIRLAQDVINAAEESVYDTLWAAKSVQEGEGGGEFKLVQAGYDFLGKKTRLSKKTIQRIVARLLEKGFIAIERQADIYQRSSTVYRVFSYRAVLDHHVRTGRTHVAKLGPGFSYVTPLAQTGALMSKADSEPSGPKDKSDLSTVVKRNPTTVPTSNGTTEVNLTTDTVVNSHLSTVVKPTTIYIDNKHIDKQTSGEKLRKALEQYGNVDDEVIDRLRNACIKQVADCRDDEIIHFVEEKGTVIRIKNSPIHNPIGFLLISVPKCFAGEAFQAFRQKQRLEEDMRLREETQQRAELEAWRTEQEALLRDPATSEDDKQFIRKCLGLSF